MAVKGYDSHTILSDYLQALRVPHTVDYSGKEFAGMPFHTLFGLTKVLEKYGVRSEGYSLKDKKELAALMPPFLARTDGGLVIVTSVGPDNVTYLTQGVAESMPLGEFEKVWNGSVLLSYPSPDAAEPDYHLHARLEFFSRSKKWVLLVCMLFLFGWFFAVNGLYRDISLWWVAAVDIFGLYISSLLVQKSANIKSAATDKVCGAIQEGGCDKVLATDASKFFGLFGWSEVGLAYFSVSLLTLLFFPSAIPALALCNICCLPFSFWSVWYQKFRARHWCTLCLCVQASLWLLFFGYLAGGWVKAAWPPTITFIVLGVAYLGVMLAINAVMPLITQDVEN